MADLHELLLEYLNKNIEKNQAVLDCIRSGEKDQICVEKSNDEALKTYYQAIKPFEDIYNFVCSYAIKKQVTELLNALKVIEEAAKSDSVKDFCDNYFDTFLSSDNTVLEKYAFSQFKTEIEQRKIVSMIYAIMKYYKENGSTN